MLDFGAATVAEDAAAPSSVPPDTPSGIYSGLGKRAFDICLALLLLPVVTPVVLVLWALMRCEGGPGFFGQKRVGKNGTLFKCWKIRTMCVDAEAQLRAYLQANPQAAIEWERDRKLTHDPRINRLGHLLRRTSLDELPQIWNVLKGEMSFVGPRPVVTVELVKYGAAASAYVAQKPGITGLWQVSGRNDVSYDARIAMDVAYLAQRSFRKDISILFRTVSAVVMRTGR
ncbi:sugar transferase [Ruegeria lacuscaerulensis]|uniref:sugar transferase n=1 Tax=Ruegeria lacuscaerulensis TaxID=55218 RepID=UPI00147D728D|nr:sugar transferase [Ruegeria lacuscaerulensis]